MARWKVAWFNEELKKASEEVSTWPKWMRERDPVMSRPLLISSDLENNFSARVLSSPGDTRGGTLAMVKLNVICEDHHFTVMVQDSTQVPKTVLRIFHDGLVYKDGRGSVSYLSPYQVKQVICAGMEDIEDLFVVAHSA